MPFVLKVKWTKENMTPKPFIFWEIIPNTIFESFNYKDFIEY